MGQGKTEALNQQFVQDCLDNPDACPDVVTGMGTFKSKVLDLKKDMQYVQMVSSRALPDVSAIIPGAHHSHSAVDVD